jgi:hypothetical protein
MSRTPVQIGKFLDSKLDTYFTNVHRCFDPKCPEMSTFEKNIHIGLQKVPWKSKKIAWHPYVSKTWALLLYIYFYRLRINILYIGKLKSSGRDEDF